MYDANKTQNNILKIPWFHTPVSHFSQKEHENMGEIAEEKLEMTDSFRIFGLQFLPIFCLK